MKNSVLVTITGLAHYYGTKPFKVGAVIKLKKEYIQTHQVHII